MHEHGSQTIQQNGRAIEVGKEISIQPRQYRKGTTIKACEACGKEFIAKAKDRIYCEAHCYDRQLVKRWLPCSRCLAAVGYGCKTTARLLGIVTDCNVSRRWKIEGIKPSVKTGRLHYYSLITQKRKREESVVKRYESEWMRHEVKAHGSASIYPDWSYEWTKLVATKKALIKYHSMSEDEKKSRNSNRCPEKKKEIARRWRRNNPRKAMESIKKWQKNNPDKVRAIRKKAETNPLYKVRKNMRKRLKELIKSAKSSATDYRRNFIGCSTKELKRHLESQFESWMTWENYGSRWHVDHIIPVAAFDQTCAKQRKACWHFSNLRPLCAKKNIAKSDKIITNQYNLPMLYA
jgi:hypothetical protein